MNTLALMHDQYRTYHGQAPHTSIIQVQDRQVPDCNDPITAALRISPKERRCRDCVQARQLSLNRKPTHRKKPQYHPRPTLLSLHRPSAIAASAASSEPIDPIASSPVLSPQLLIDHSSPFDELDFNMIESSSPRPSSPIAAAANPSAIPAEVEPWTLASPLPVNIHSSPLTHFDLLKDILSCFILYGYALIRADDIRRAFALRLAEYQLRASHTGKTISGEVTMMDLSKVDGFDASDDGKEWRRIVYELLDQLGVKESTCSHFVAEKLLKARKDNPAQDLHFDAINGPWTPRNRYSAVIYCTDGSTSTFLPRYPRSSFQPRETNRKSLQYYSKYMKDEWYHSIPVNAGDMVIFSQRVAHFGPSNTSATERLAGFCMVSASRAKDQDDYQMFRWRYIQEAFGSRSKEHADAVVAAALHSPLTRFDLHSRLLTTIVLNLRDRNLWNDFLNKSNEHDRAIFLTWKKWLSEQPRCIPKD